jgi:hypothetical protein
MFLIMPSFNIFYQIVSYIIFMFVLIPFYVIEFKICMSTTNRARGDCTETCHWHEQLINPDVDKT